MNKNIPTPLASSPDGELKYQPQDPETAALVSGMLKTAEESQAFIKEKQEGNDPEAQVDPKVTVTPNPEFDRDPSSQMITEALVPLDNVPVHDMEKELFLKAVLNDQPVRLTIDLYKGQMKVALRSRSTYEQKRIYDILELDQKEKFTDPTNIALQVTRLQYYLAAVMVERINDSLFSELELKPGKTVEEHAAMMRDFVAKNLEGLTLIRWTSILNALRIFENKCAQLNSEAANEDFWSPRG